MKKSPQVYSSVIILLIITIISGVVYFNSLPNPFHFDDEYYVTGNTYIRELSNIKEAFLQPKMLVRFGWPSGHYRPLVFTSYALNYYLGGLNPIGYHLVNLAFHIGSAFLVFLIVQAMLGSNKQVAGGVQDSSLRGDAPPPSLRAKRGNPTKSLRAEGEAISMRFLTSFGMTLRVGLLRFARNDEGDSGTRNDEWAGSKSLAMTGKGGFFAALAAGLIFLTTPFNSEVVNYITARSSVMSSFFYLLAFYYWIRFREGRGSQAPPTYYLLPTTYYYIASLLFFLLGMLTKEVVITLPVALFLYDLYFVSLKGRDQYIKRLIAYLPFVLAATVPYFILRLFFWGAFLPRFQRSILVQLYTEMPVLIKYLRLLVFPVGLSVDHNTRIYVTFFALPVIASYILLISILLLALWLYTRKSTEWRLLSFFIIWFFVVLMPTTVFPLNTILQENRGYLAAVSFAVSAGIILVKGLPALLGIRLRTAILCLIIVTYSAGTVYRNSLWKDDLSLWTDAIAKGSKSVMAYTHLSKAYISRKEYDKSEELLKKTLKLYPYDFYTHYNLSWVYYKTNRYEEALKEAEAALKSLPSSYAAYFNMGLIYYAMGNPDMAVKNYKKALELNPGYAEAYFNLGVIYEMSGQSDVAIAHYLQVVKDERLNPRLARSASQRLGRLKDRVQ